MVSPSRCPPWQPERPRPTRREPRRAQRSYTTRRDTIFLHALWSFEVTRKWGPEVAKKFGDAHEISIENSTGDRLKDLYNDNGGRLLGVDPANKDRLGAEVILEALEAGKLQIDPVKIGE